MKSKKKLSVGKYKYKNRGLLLYQNLWHWGKLTKKQKKWSKFKNKINSTELGHRIAKQVLLKTVNTFEKSSFNHGENIYLCLQQAKNKHIGFHNKKALSLVIKPFWFFDKAVPIPGVSFLKKANNLYKTKLHAYKIVKSWLQIFNKKQIKILMNFQKKQNLSKNFNSIMLMESLYQSILRKTAFALNAVERKALFYSGIVVVNGIKVQKKVSVSKPADFLRTLKNKTCWIKITS